MKTISKTLIGKNSYLGTFFTQFIVLALGFFTIKLATILLTTENFGIYNVIKRGISLISFPFLVGLGISIPKYISVNYYKDKKKTIEYIIAGIIVMSCMFLILLVILILLGNYKNKIIGIDDKKIKLNTILFISVVALNLYTFCYSCLKGFATIRIANTMNIICLGMIPIISIVFFCHDISQILIFNGISVIIVCFGLLTRIDFGTQYPINTQNLKNNFKKLLAFGLPRIFGEFALFGLFAIPLFISANVKGLEYTAYLSLSLSLFQLFAGMLEFINIVMFSKIGKLAGEENWNEIKIKVKKILTIISIYSILAILIAFIIVKPVVILFFGEKYAQSAEILKVLVLGILPYVFYLVLRNVLDIISEVPINTINLIIGLIVSIALIYSKKMNLSIEQSILSGIIYIGLGNFIGYLIVIKKRIKF